MKHDVSYLKMAEATRPKRRALQNWLLVWWEKGIKKSDGLTKTVCVAQHSVAGAVSRREIMHDFEFGI